MICLFVRDISKSKQIEMEFKVNSLPKTKFERNFSAVRLLML
jgi:hypothetical protein